MNLIDAAKLALIQLLSKGANEDTIKSLRSAIADAEALAEPVPEREAIAESVRLMREWREADQEFRAGLNNSSTPFVAYRVITQKKVDAEQAIRDYLDKMK